MECGRRVNRHRKRRIHIEKMKKRYLLNPFMGCAKSMSYAQYIACSKDPERDGEYWKACFLSGPRQYAKKATSSVLRSQWRRRKAELMLMDEDELEDESRCASSGSWYRKHYDYAWTVW